jgi:pimeloyl-ACP methyl ester carboxylesterase
MSLSRTSKIALSVLALVLVAYAAGYRADIATAEVERAYGLSYSRSVDVGGVAINYTDMGDGPAVLLIHGSGADIGAWQPLSAALVEEGYRVLAPDLPGSGLSGMAADGEYTAISGAAFVEAFLDRLGIAQASVIGHSTGGQIAWRAALEDGSSVSRLILVATTGHPHPSPITWKLAQVPVLGEVMRQVTPRFMVRMNLEDAFFDDSKITEELVERYYTMIRREGAREALLARMRAVSFEGHERVACITQPTLVLWGEEDAWLPPELGEWFAAEIPDAQLVLLPGIGHNIPEEVEPQALAKTIGNWLAAAEDQPPRDEPSTCVTSLLSGVQESGTRP